MGILSRSDSPTVRPTPFDCSVSIPPKPSLVALILPNTRAFPDTNAGADWLFKWGQRAKSFATETLDGRQVRVVVDPESDRRGSYGCLLAFIHVDGESFSLRLIEDGYARMYDSTFSLRDELAQTESRARNNDVGLWDFDGANPALTRQIPLVGRRPTTTCLRPLRTGITIARISRAKTKPNRSSKTLQVIPIDSMATGTV